MPEYKLTYYDIKGLGEPVRYIFAVAGVDYEDYRIHKDDTTYPKLPAELKESKRYNPAKNCIFIP
jgi:hypothetical protein